MGPAQLLDIRTTRLSPAQCRDLLVLARRSLAIFLVDGRVAELEVDDPVLKLNAGAFVTLRTCAAEGDATGEYNLDSLRRLRGCIGHTEADLPLYHVVQEMAVAAATRDYRFPPITAAELEGISIEISILSTLKPCRRIRDIQLGRDGLLIVCAGRRGLLLPQVPGAFGWNQEEYVRNLCHKAGLPEDAWRSKEARLFSFTTLEFGEEDFRPS